MPISQDRMITLAKAGAALVDQLEAMRELVKFARDTVAQGDTAGALNLLDEVISKMQVHRSVAEPIALERAHFERHAQRNTKHKLKMQHHRGMEALGYTEPPVRRQGVPAQTTAPGTGTSLVEDLYIPPPSVGRVATPQGSDFARIAEPSATQGLTLADYLADPSLEPAPRQPPTLSALGVRGKGDRADLITSVPDDVNATPELGADPFASPPHGGVGE